MSERAQPDYSQASVAITGASGYLGASLLDALLTLEKPPKEIVRTSRSMLEPHPRCRDIAGDPGEPEVWRAIVQSADVIFHLAGNTSLAWAEQNPAESLSTSIFPVLQLERAAVESGRIPRVVYASTSTVHGVPEALPVSEESPTAPVTVYDLHKKFTEETLFLAASRGRIEAICLRLANVYGVSGRMSSSSDRGILNRMVGTALGGGSIKLYGGGDYLRDYIYVDDVVDAFLLAGRARNVSGRSFIIASGMGTTIKDAFGKVAKRGESITGKPVPMSTTPWPDGALPIEFRSFVADVGAFKKTTGWSPRVSLDEGIERMIAANLQQQSVNK